MIILDSNVWIAYFDEDDFTHEQASELFKSVDKNELVVTEYILLEVSTVLKQKLGGEFARQFIKKIFQEKFIFLSSDNFYKETILLFQSLKDDKLSFVDVSLLYLAKQYQIKTFDKHLQKRIGR